MCRRLRCDKDESCAALNNAQVVCNQVPITAYFSRLAYQIVPKIRTANIPGMLSGGDSSIHRSNQDHSRARKTG